MDNSGIVKKLNEMEDLEQIAHFRSKCKEFKWEIYFAEKNNAKKYHHKDIRNFHANIMNDYIKQIKRTEIVDKLNNKIKQWELWTGKEKIVGSYGDIIFKMIELIGG